MTTLEELAEETKKLDQLISQLTKISKSLIVEEFTLLDLIAKEEQYNETLNDLRATMNNIIEIRQMLSLENCDNGPF